MQIAWALPCRYAEEIGGVGNFLGAGADTFRFAELPVNLTVICAVNVIVPEHELGVEETLRVGVIDPDMELHPVAEVIVRLDDYEHRPPGRQPSLISVVNLTMPIDRFGQRTVHFELQDRTTTVPLFILSA